MRSVLPVHRELGVAAKEGMARASSNRPVIIAGRMTSSRNDRTVRSCLAAATSALQFCASLLQIDGIEDA